MASESTPWLWLAGIGAAVWYFFSRPQPTEQLPQGDLGIGDIPGNPVGLPSGPDTTPGGFGSPATNPPLPIYPPVVVPTGGNSRPTIFGHGGTPGETPPTQAPNPQRPSIPFPTTVVPPLSGPGSPNPGGSPGPTAIILTPPPVVVTPSVRAIIGAPLPPPPPQTVVAPTIRVIPAAPFNQPAPLPPVVTPTIRVTVGAPLGGGPGSPNPGGSPGPTGSIPTPVVTPTIRTVGAPLRPVPVVVPKPPAKPPVRVPIPVYKRGEVS